MHFLADRGQLFILFSVQLRSGSNQGHVLQVKRQDLKLLSGSVRSVSSACGSRVQSASEPARCKHEAQPLPSQSLPLNTQHPPPTA